VAAKKRNRQQGRAKREADARRAAERARRQAVARRRWLTIGGGVAIVAVVGVVGYLLTRGGGTDVAKADAKRCVAVSEALPEGAPKVPVKVGPAPTALVAKDLKPGTGAVVTADQSLTVNYIGVSCSTGKIFDSSYSRGQPATFSLSNVIPGWQKGIPGMKVGGQRLLGIPPELGYGESGSGSKIGPGETLWFVVEVLDAKAAEPG